MKRVLVVIGIGILLMECQGASAFDNALSGASANGDVVARVHWIGKKEISAETNLAGVMGVWNLPETARFETELVEKLAMAPWRLVRGETNRNSTQILAPVLRDLIEGESYIEIRQPANAAKEPGQMVFAIRLPKEKAELWRTNLAAALESLTAIKPVSTKNGWSLKKHHVPNLIQLDRAGDWTVLGAAHETNGLFEETLARIRRNRIPFEAQSGKVWLDADVDLPRAAAALGHELKLPEDFPRIALTMKGEGQNVRSAGRLVFPKAISITLNPWNFPTNLISDNLSSLTVIRGWMPEFVSRLWDESRAGALPEQLYIWSYDEAPMETYLATPLADASNAVSEVSDYVLKKYDSWFATHDMARFQRAKKFNGLEWKGNPFISPFMESTNSPIGNFVLAGFFPFTASREDPPEAMIREIQGATNLVYYHWELTGSRIEELIFITQIMRVISGHPQLAAQSAGLQWLTSISKGLGPSATMVSSSNPTEFSFTRSSSIPFTAMELHWLTAWLESGDFPVMRILPSPGGRAGN